MRIIVVVSAVRWRRTETNDEFIRSIGIFTHITFHIHTRIQINISSRALPAAGNANGVLLTMRIGPRQYQPRYEEIIYYDRVPGRTVRVDSPFQA